MGLLGEQVGNIHILELIGEGGMGDVYVGFDEKLERKVALKAIRQDRLDSENRARLLAEARVLSRLDHPHICRIYEYLEEGDHQFLVLELIAGQELRQAVEAGLDTAAKWRIAEQVGEALIAAHAEGVIHRDLKPGNVMLTSEGEVKVLDFGLARFTDRRQDLVPTAGEGGGLSRGVSACYKTQFGLVVGTAESMSPEQARGEATTAASDMYSYGLLLQELFTGRPAYEPGLPVDLLITKAAEADTLPAEGIDPDLSLLIERMKSLAPSARPTAVEALARLRFIGDKPKRRARQLLVALGVLLIVLGALKYTADLRSERAAAIEARNQAEEAQHQAEEVVELLVDLFEEADPNRAEEERLDTRQLLDRGAARVREELADQPRTRARLLDTIGRIHTKLGLYGQANSLLEEALATRRELYGADHLEVATSLQNLADASYQVHADVTEGLYLEALQMRERLLGPEHPEVAASAFGLGSFYARNRRLDDAREYFQRSLEIREAALGERHPLVAESLKNLGGIHLYQDRVDEAEVVVERALSILEETLRPAHPKLAEVHESLALIYLDRGRVEEAVNSHLRALEIAKEGLGEKHPMVGMVMSNLGLAYAAQGRADLAETTLLEALAFREEVLGPDNPTVGYTLHALADFYKGEQRFAEAEALYRRVTGIFGEKSPRTERARRSLLEILRTGGREEEAREVAAALERSLEPAPEPVPGAAPEVVPDASTVP